MHTECTPTAFLSIMWSAIVAQWVFQKNMKYFIDSANKVVEFGKHTQVSGVKLIMASPWNEDFCPIWNDIEAFSSNTTTQYHCS